MNYVKNSLTMKLWSGLQSMCLAEQQELARLDITVLEEQEEERTKQVARRREDELPEWDREEY